MRGLIGIVIGFIFAFYIISTTFTPLETSANTLTWALENATSTDIQNLSTLPNVAILLFVLAVIFGLITYAIRSAGVSD